MRKKFKILIAAVVITAIVSCSLTVTVNATAYKQAVKYGYNGTEIQMLCSLAAETGDVSGEGEIGGTSYEEAKVNGFTGSIEEWYSLFVGKKADCSKTVFENANKSSLAGWLKKVSSKNVKKEAQTDVNGNKSAYLYACDYGFEGSVEDWLASLIGKSDEDNGGIFSITASAAGNIKSAYIQSNEKGNKSGMQKWLCNLFGIQDGEDGEKGLSAYEIAVNNGYSGTEVEWLRSLAGQNGKSAYEIAKDNGYSGTELEWLASLVGEKGQSGSNGKSAYEIAKDKGYIGTEQDWLASLIGPTGAQGANGNNGKSAYELAKDNGFKGTEKEWLDSLKVGSKGDAGADGKSAYDLAKDDGFEGTLSQWLASLKGEKGETGNEGATGAKGEKGDTGATGAQGATGSDGKSAYEIAVKNGYKGSETEWLESLKGESTEYGNDGKSAFELAQQEGFEGTLAQWLDSLVGENGVDGTNGEDGKSAYDLAVANGYEGTVTQWLASLVGKDGEDGTNGKSAYDLAVDNGYKGTVQEWLASLVGANGKDGKSAYEIAVEHGYKGTEEQWLASLVGAKGEDGKSAYEIAVEKGYKGTESEWLASLTGATGANGKSAYEVAKEKGYTGTEQEWLSSLVGSSGAAGTNGKSAYDLAVENGYQGTLSEWLVSLTGAKGEKGDAGAKGDTGAKGDAGKSVVNAYVNEEKHLILEMSDGSTIDSGYVGVTTTEPTATEYTVTFKDHDGTQLKQQKVKSGEDATPPANPTRAGYTFKGWNGTYTKVTADQVVYATYDAVTEPTLIVESATAAAGDTVNVTLRILNNPGIAGAKFTINYDEKLTLQSATVGEAFSALDYTAPGKLTSPCSFSWDSLDAESKTDGTVVTLTFKVANTAVVGSSLAVNCTYTDGDVFSGNATMDDVSLNIVNGNVIVK